MGGKGAYYSPCMLVQRTSMLVVDMEKFRDHPRKHPFYGDSDLETQND